MKVVLKIRCKMEQVWKFIKSNYKTGLQLFEIFVCGSLSIMLAFQSNKLTVNQLELTKITNDLAQLQINVAKNETEPFFQLDTNYIPNPYSKSKCLEINIFNVNQGAKYSIENFCIYSFINIHYYIEGQPIKTKRVAIQNFYDDINCDYKEIKLNTADSYNVFYNLKKSLIGIEHPDIHSISISDTHILEFQYTNSFSENKTKYYKLDNDTYSSIDKTEEKGFVKEYTDTFYPYCLTALEEIDPNTIIKIVEDTYKIND
ncbi:hypothetical protein V6615_13135 [Oscillospiraceae bacterium PP1C4]